MKKITATFTLALTTGLFLALLIATDPSQALPNQPEGQLNPIPEVDIYTSQHMEAGIVSTSFQSIFGPEICTAWGDPFSPANSRYTPGLYSYRYRIEIPPNYPSDILRVEIFDPDSMNSPENNALVMRTDTAVAAGLSPTANLSCSNNNQKVLCLIPTEEVDNSGIPVGNADFNKINPFWILRVDENRGNGTNSCSNISYYTEIVNTRTLYELFYYKENEDSTLQVVPLTAYTGQDGLETIDHETDLRWVSPGAQISFGLDKDAPGVDVPVNPGSRTANGFEIDLTSEVPNIVTDPQNGNRYIYLYITSIKGGSENNFDLWAGPPDYVNTVPSDVNQRNIYILNNPGSHNSQGVKIYALGNLPQNSAGNYPVVSPLIDISPELAGESLFISLFDADAGTSPPITFYLDSIPKEDWSLTFGTGGIDPDGVPSNSRCTPGSCQDEWIDPPYQIKLPNGTKNCDFTDPTVEDCTPFYGGTLMAVYNGGFGDTYGWQISGFQEPTPDPIVYEGCDAFPIAIHEGIRSVTPPGQGANPYPSANDFTGPATPRTYESFSYHQDNVPLLQAQEGTIFKIEQGFSANDLGWLVWNEGINASAYTLEKSLIWPGNIHDYTNHGDGGVVLPGQDYVVRGFIEAGDPSDTELHIGDWIAANSGSINSASIRNVLDDHSELERTLRLPIWDATDGAGATGRYRTSRFAIFRFHGYRVSSTGTWILLEFIRFDSSCGQPATPITNISLTGANRVQLQEEVTLTANISPMTATQPISYTWEATDFAPITQGSGISDTVTFNWAITGTKTITVTAVNPVSTITQTHTVNVTNLADGKDLTIVGSPQLLTPLPIEEGNPVEFAVTVKNLGDKEVTTHTWVNLFVNPHTINPKGIPEDESAGFNILYDLEAGQSKTIHVTLPDGLNRPNTPHQIYAMVDTRDAVEEVEETNNISAPLALDASNFIEWKYIYLPMIIKN